MRKRFNWGKRLNMVVSDAWVGLGWGVRGGVRVGTDG